MTAKIDKCLAQEIVNTLKDICGKHINFINASGIIFASTDKHRIGMYHEVGYQAFLSQSTIEVNSDNSYTGTQQGINMPILNDRKVLAVIGISGHPDEVRKYAQLLEKVTKLLIKEKEMNEHSRSLEEKMSFVVRSLIENTVMDRTYLEQCLNDLRVKTDTLKKVLIIQVLTKQNETEYSKIHTQLKQILDNQPTTLYLFNYPNKYIAIIDDWSFHQNEYKIKQKINEMGGSIRVAVGKSYHINYLNKSYETAIIAEESLNEHSESLAHYDDLSLEIVLAAISEQTKEAFCQKIIKQLSSEDVALLKVYYETNMSLEQTSKSLYLHKNTIQYKLNQILKKSGKNPREFKDAVLLYVATKIQRHSR
ncbi:CdaR family transcriptional regulator [Atopobacter phocae]|uniref:CdaR family transcriptional regulator n=1 Tax=Atopobacter phocae TaxID=136492 RepID=UPI0004702CBB|nr:sugar diacid recognition domain-containing protein [Atopobacter phocae]